MLGFLVPLCFFLGIAFIAYYFFRKSDFFQTLEPVVIPERLGWTLLIVLIALNVFAYDAAPGIGLGIFYAALSAGLILSFEKRSPLVYTVGILAAVAGLLIAFRANEVILQINLVIANISIILLVLLHTFEKMQWSGLWLIKNAGLYIVRAFKHIFSIFLGAKNKSSRAMQLFYEFFKVSIITLVVLVIFANLLTAADPVFNKLIQEIKDEVFSRTFLSLVLGIGLFFVLTLRIRSNSEQSKLKILGFYDVAIPSGALVLLLAFFLFIQSKYLFGNHASVEAFDLTYSEYVRKGFMELLIATLLGGLISYLLILKIKALDGIKKIRALQVINVVLVLELALLLVSAFQRDLIYVDVYGYTRVRVIGLAFLIWLALVLIQLFAFNIFKKWKEMYLFSGIFAISIVGFLVLNVLNVDKMIAEANLARTEKTDTAYNALLSYDAHSSWTELVKSSYQRYEALRLKPTLTEEEIHDLADAELTLITLTDKVTNLERKFENGTEAEEVDLLDRNGMSRKSIQKWQAYNQSAAEAYAYVQENKPWLYDLRICLLTEMADLEWNYDHNKVLINSPEGQMTVGAAILREINDSRYQNSPLMPSFTYRSNLYQKEHYDYSGSVTIPRLPDPATSCASVLPST